MRYYIYLDKEFLQTLFCSIETTSFDIEVMEFSITKNYGTSNELSLEPCHENVCDIDNAFEKEVTDKERKRNKCENISKEHIGVSYEKSNTFNMQTEKRYINIEDVASIKNNTFYHKLIKKMDEEIKKENSRVVMEKGIIHEYDGNINTDKDGFFILNNNYVWFDRTKLSTDSNLLCKMNCMTNVIGYRINCNKEDKVKNIIKAIAIFIE